MAATNRHYQHNILLKYKEFEKAFIFFYAEMQDRPTERLQKWKLAD